jgi:hypothetical protein
MDCRPNTRIESAEAARDAKVVEHMAALAAQYPRYGYRRIQIFLARCATAHLWANENGGQFLKLKTVRRTAEPGQVSSDAGLDRGAAPNPGACHARRGERASSAALRSLAGLGWRA